MAKSFASDLLRGPAGPTLEEARAAMLASGDAPVGELEARRRKAERKAQKGSRGQGGSAATVAPVAMPDLEAEITKNLEDVPAVLPEARVRYSDTDLENMRHHLVRIYGQKRAVTKEMALNARLTEEQWEALSVHLGGEKPEPVAVAEVVPVVAAPVAVVQPAREPQEKTLRVDDKDFTAEIKKENNVWVGEIIFKNGAGTERFTAATKDEIMVKLLAAKGHATVKVRQVVRDSKLGRKANTWADMHTFAANYAGMQPEEYQALVQPAKDALVRACSLQQALEFKDLHPEFYRTAKNGQDLLDYLGEKEWPPTVHNYELAYADLSDVLEVRPTEKEVVKEIVVTPAPKIEDSIAVAEIAAAVPTVAPVSAPAVAPRKRGTSGLTPRQSSSEDSELDTVTKKPQEPSDQDLKKMPFKELQRIARQSFNTKHPSLR